MWKSNLTYFCCCLQHIYLKNILNSINKTFLFDLFFNWNFFLVRWSPCSKCQTINCAQPWSLPTIFDQFLCTHTQHLQHWIVQPLSNSFATDSTPPPQLGFCSTSLPLSISSERWLAGSPSSSHKNRHLVQAEQLKFGPTLDGFPFSRKVGKK